MATKEEIFLLFDSIGINPSIETLNDRIKLQKIVYLAEVFGINLDFNFTWYTHGPYSSPLTMVMYNKTKGDYSNFKQIPSYEKKITALKKLLGNDLESIDKLELVTSLHYVLSIAKKTGASEKEALELFYDEKPQFNEQDVKKYLSSIKKIIKESN